MVDVDPSAAAVEELESEEEEGSAICRELEEGRRRAAWR